MSRYSYNQRKNISVKSGKRLSRKKEILPRILILTEGYTEEIYFNKIANIFSLQTVEIKRSCHTNVNGIVKEAKTIAKNAQQEGNEYNFIFCIFDLDTINNKDYINILNNTKNKLTKILPIYSNPCIEVWFILHYEYCDQPFSKRNKKTIGNEVKSYFKNHYNNSYDETNKVIINEIAEKYEEAVKNARQLIENQMNCESINPITTIYRIIEVLQNIDKKLNKYDFESFKVESFIEKHLFK